MAGVDDGISQVEGDAAWRIANEQTRSAAKWIIVSLGGVAAVVFGAGPIITRPLLSWSDNLLQLLLAAGFGAVSLAGIVLLIGHIGAVLLPTRVTLASLPTALITELNAAADDRLPSDASSYSEFVKRARFHERYASQLQAELQRINSQIASSDADDEDEVERLRRKGHTLESYLETAIENRLRYRRTVDYILEDGAFLAVRGVFEGKRRTVLALAAIAAIGGLGFQLSLATNSIPKAADSSARVAYLSPLNTEEGKAIWAALKVDGCKSSDGRVPVLHISGRGGASDPYVVQTVRLQSSCDPAQFTFDDDQVMLSEPVTGNLIVKVP